MKYKIAIVRLGHCQHIVDFKTIKVWKSKLFEITGISCVEHLPEGDVQDGFLDIKYSREELAPFVSCPSDCDFIVGIMPYRFIDNFYMHRISEKSAIISLYGIADILKTDNISIEHFVIKQIYELCAIKHLIKDLSSDDVYSVVHLDTRGCLFDMNGERSDIVYNTEQPIICDECKVKFRNRQVQQGIIEQLEKELKKIKKPFILRAERWIKRYPLVAIFLSFTMSVIISVVANVICALCLA